MKNLKETDSFRHFTYSLSKLLRPICRVKPFLRKEDRSPSFKPDSGTARPNLLQTEVLH